MLYLNGTTNQYSIEDVCEKGKTKISLDLLPKHKFGGAGGKDAHETKTHLNTFTTILISGKQLLLQIQLILSVC